MKKLLTSPYVLLILPPLFWGGNAVLGRFAVGDIPPIQLTLVRWTIALIVLLPVTWPSLKRQLPVIHDNFSNIALLSILGVVGFVCLLYIGLQTTTAINTGLLEALIPIVIALLSRLLLKKSLTIKQALGIALSMIGVIAVLSRGEINRLINLQLLPGDLWILLAVFCWGLYSVRLHSHPVPIPPMNLLTVQVFIAFFFLVPMAAIEMIVVSVLVINWVNLLLLLYFGIFAGILALYFWIRGTKALGPQIAGFYLNLIPVFTALFGILLLGEKIVPVHIIGMLFICLGIFLAANLKVKRKDKSPR